MSRSFNLKIINFVAFAIVLVFTCVGDLALAQAKSSPGAAGRSPGAAGAKKPFPGSPLNRPPIRKPLPGTVRAPEHKQPMIRQSEPSSTVFDLGIAASPLYFFAPAGGAFFTATFDDEIGFGLRVLSGSQSLEADSDDLAENLRTEFFATTLSGHWEVASFAFRFGGTYLAADGRYGFREVTTGADHLASFSGGFGLVELSVGNVWRFAHVSLGVDWIGGAALAYKRIAMDDGDMSTLRASGAEDVILATRGVESVDEAVENLMTKQLSFYVGLLTIAYTF